MREIALQVYNFIRLLSDSIKKVLYGKKKKKSSNIRILNLLKQLKRFQPCILIGGIPLQSDFDHLRRNPGIIIGTPGRLAHI